MKNWLNLTRQQQVDLFNQISSQTGLQAQAIEKDAWVTLALRMLFNSKLSEHLFFKGGTSLSKAYKLIERFSEDIDLAIDRKYLGFGGELTKGQIRKLRKKSHRFVADNMTEILRSQLENYGIKQNHYQIVVDNTKVSDQDPEVIKLKYKSVFEKLPYLQNQVLIEVGARSQTEPYKQVKLKSIIDEQYPDSAFTEKEFVVNTVIPEKTLLEKLILLHEEFSKPEEKIRYRRMSRHYYDIGQILKTYLGEKALINSELFQSIIHHRAKYTPIKTINYETLNINNLSIIPSAGFYDLYKKDYSEMQENMIYGDSLNFEELMNYIQSKI